MTKVEEFLREPTDSLDPRLRKWKKLLAEPGTTATLEIDTPESDIGQLHSEIELHFIKDGKPIPSGPPIPWDDDLNAGLIHQVPKPVRAVNSEQEVERFALSLRAALRKAEREFGDGYFNAVLVDSLHERGLAENKEIEDVLKHVSRVNRPGPDHTSYKICREMIENAIKERHQELICPLGYPWDDAAQIIVSALARYLDVRFSVSNRRKRGLI